jgi:hypothetical protein
MDNLRGNSSYYGPPEDNNIGWVVMFAVLAAGILWMSYLCKNRWRPIVIVQHTTRPELELGSSTAINVDTRPFMMQLSSPKRRSTSPRDPADMV